MKSRAARPIRLLPAAAVAGTALAQESNVDNQAREYFDRGTLAFDEKRYVEALAVCSAGYELSKTVPLLSAGAQARAF